MAEGYHGRSVGTVAGARSVVSAPWEREGKRDEGWHCIFLLSSFLPPSLSPLSFALRPLFIHSLAIFIPYTPFSSFSSFSIICSLYSPYSFFLVNFLSPSLVLPPRLFLLFLSFQ